MNPSKKMRLISSSGGSVREGGQWECPVCLLVPSKEIYLCSNGHSVCCLCTSKVKNCPTCRVGIGGQIKQQRNFALEHVLDSMKFECSWNGCEEVLSRSDFVKHEAMCSHNPSVLKLCHFMGIPSCNFRFTLESMNGVTKIDQVLEHIKSHGYLEMSIKLGETEKSVICVANLKSPSESTKYKLGSTFVKQILALDYGNKKYLFLQVLRIYLDDAGQEILSIVFLQLTPNFGPEKFTFNLFLKRASNVDAMIRWGTACTATTSWGIRPMKINQFMKYCEMPASGNYSFPFPIPVAHLENYHTDAFGEIHYGYFVSIKK